MEYTLRAATDADYEFLYRLDVATMRDHVIRAFGRWDEGLHARLFRERFDLSKVRIVMVAEQAVGMLETATTDTEVVLSNIRIAPTYQRWGLGTAIVSDLVADAHRARRSVRLRVLKVNPARSLYERLGFTVVAEQPAHYVMRTFPSTLR